MAEGGDAAPSEGPVSNSIETVSFTSSSPEELGGANGGTKDDAFPTEDSRPPALVAESSTALPSTPQAEDEAAASTLAAVAAAASANNSSPAAAAAAARNIAPGVVPAATIAALPPPPAPANTDVTGKSIGEGGGGRIRLASVRDQLKILCDEKERQRTPDNDVEQQKSSGGTAVAVHGTEGETSEGAAQKNDFIAEKLANGENDAFLRHLMLLSSLRAAVEDDGDAITKVADHDVASTNDTKTDRDAVEQQPPEEGFVVESDFGNADDEVASSRSSAAASKVSDLLVKAERAYDALVELLPPQPDVPPHLEDDDEETMHVIPDLLPPCTTLPGDATAAFFRACSAQNAGSNSEGGSGLSGSDRVDGYSSEAGSGMGKSSMQNGTPSSATADRTAVSQSAASSVLSSVISSVKKHSNKPSSPGREGALSGVFRKRRGQGGSTTGSHQREGGKHTSTSTTSAAAKPADNGDSDENDDGTPVEYMVLINREMLGLTVENVLERTVVRTVLPGGAAKKAGARVGSLIVKVGSVETKNLTHFETIDELRQSQRPLKLVLRRISKEALRGAREEMGRLIRGGGFGMGSDSGRDDEVTGQGDDGAGETKGLDERSRTQLPREEFEVTLHRCWSTERAKVHAKKDEHLSSVEEKLVWILTLLVIGLEREAAKPSFPLVGENSVTGFDASTPASQQRNNHHSHHHHTSKDYADAAKSVSKTLMDYVKLHLDGSAPKAASVDPQQVPAPGMHQFRRGRVSPAPHQPLLNPMGRHLGKTAAKRQQQHLLGLTSGPGVAKRGGQLSPSPGPAAQAPHPDSPLLQIGDVLHRTRTFLADPLSPPAALLRGEVIALLCDILDIDTDMQLSEEEAASAIAGHKAGPINDLGSAGSLLKLIVLNCTMMRSPGCVDAAQKSKASRDRSIEDPDNRKEGRERKQENLELEEDSHKKHAGNRFLAVVHRLAASRSTSARVTACSLGPVLWSHLDFPHQLQLRGVITRALHDVEVIVRKSTATVLHEIAELVFDPRAVPWLVLMCERAMTDPEPQLRAAAMTLTWHLAEHLPNAFLGDASKGSRSLRRLPARTDPTFAEVYLLQCKLLPVATRLAEDRAPSVRLAVAAQCDRLSNALGDHWSSVIIDLLQALLGDADERVRSEAALCMPRLVESVLMESSGKGVPAGGVSVLESLLPVAIKLLKDPSAAVRVSLATASGELLTLLVGLESLEEMNTNFDGGVSSDSAYKRHKKHVDETLIPLVQRLLHDTDPEVTSAALRAVTNASRGNVREISSRRPHKRRSESEDDTVSLSSYQSHASAEKKEPVFIPVLSEKQVLRLLPTLSDLATSAQWRVRQSAVEIVPALLGCTHRLETRSEIAQLCVQLMGDTVDAVRRTAAECLCLGGGSLGGHGEDSSGEWITAIVIPHLRTCKDSADSKQRMLSLKMVEVILLNGVCPTGRAVSVPDGEQSGPQSSPLRVLVEMAGSLSCDRVVNVRLNVGRVLGNVVSVLEEEELLYVIETLEQQISSERTRAGGGDRDVLYFAKRSMGWAQMRLEEVSLLTHDDPNTSR